MGLGLAKFKSEAYVQPGAAVGVAPGGIQGTVQPGAVTVNGIEPGGITVNLSTGGALIPVFIAFLAFLYFLYLMPLEVTLLIIYIIWEHVSNDKYFIISAVTAFYAVKS
jgi:hypothetical protein